MSTEGEPRPRPGEGHRARQIHRKIPPLRVGPETRPGYCHCTCGGRTTLITETDTPRGRIKGKYNKYIYGHKPLTKTTEQRFLEKVDKTPGQGGSGQCWIWTGMKNRSGYGMFGIRRKIYLAHRVAYEFWVGPIPETDDWNGSSICHRCDTRDCVSPHCLFVGSHDVNMHDMAEKERQQRGSAHAHAKLDEGDVVEILRHLAEGTLLQREIAALYGVSRSQISEINSGKAWKHVPRDLG